MTREEAIEFGNMWLQINEDCKDTSTYAFFQMAIKALEKEPRTGHWIIKGRNLVDDFIPIGHFCSECGEQALLNPYGTHMENLSNYCPNCGARMVGEE